MLPMAYTNRSLCERWHLTVLAKGPLHPMTCSSSTGGRDTVVGVLVGAGTAGKEAATAAKLKLDDDLTSISHRELERGSAAATLQLPLLPLPCVYAVLAEEMAEDEEVREAGAFGRSEN